MSGSRITNTHLGRITTSTTAWACWKCLLSLIACASPGPGYDTSTRILSPKVAETDPSPLRLLSHSASRLVRWDALYFVNIAQEGYRYEQEWAFGWGRVLGLIANAFPSFPSVPPLSFQASVGIVVAHISHLLSVFVSYALAWQIVPAQSPRRSSIAFVTAFLHIITPGGLFLSAGYAESLFSCLNFTGMLLYSLTFNSNFATTKPLARWLGATASLTASGACFGLSTTVRSNGSLSISIFVFAVSARVKSISTQDIFSLPGIANAILFSVPYAIASVLTLAGTVYPQYIAFREYCTDGNTRPWCSHLPPSIYSWVQEHYWNVGFSRYWASSNSPLFLVAAPMIAISTSSALVAPLAPDVLASATSPARPRPMPELTETKAGREKRPGSKVEEEVEEEEEEEGEEVHKSTPLLAHLALPQSILVLLATTTFHVQIVNRIASGYPIWYLVLAMALTSPSASAPSPPPSQAKDVTSRDDGDMMASTAAAAAAAATKWKTSARRLADRLWSTSAQERRVQWLVRLMVCYAIVQGGSFASFLPPA